MIPVDAGNSISLVLHAAQTTLPQSRQWWRRLPRRENALSQRRQAARCLSSIQKARASTLVALSEWSMDIMPLRTFREIRSHSTFLSFSL